jgi:hypothetical protein
MIKKYFIHANFNSRFIQFEHSFSGLNSAIGQRISMIILLPNIFPYNLITLISDEFTLFWHPKLF